MFHGIAAGRLRQVVEIQGYAAAGDDYGFQSKTYTTRETVRAEVKLIEGSEVESAGQYKGRQMYRFIMRGTTLAQTDRLVWDGRNFEIVEIADKLERGRVLQVKTAEVI